MAEKEVRKTAAKKAVRRTTTKVAPRKTAVRKTATAVSERKAPARVTAQTPVRAPRSKKPLIIASIFLAVLGASAAIGFSDRGQIDVSAVIAQRKQNATPEEQERFKTVPVQQGQSGLVNGGLVGMGKSTPPPAPAEEETATSTEETASSTEETATEQTETEREDSEGEAETEGDTLSETEVVSDTQMETEPTSAEETTAAPAQ